MTFDNKQAKHFVFQVWSTLEKKFFEIAYFFEKENIFSDTFSWHDKIY